MRLPAVVAAALATLALAGCSSGDGGATTTTAVVTAPPATSAAAPTTKAPTGSAVSIPGLETDLIRQFLVQFGGGLNPTDAELSCVTGALPPGTIDKILADFGRTQADLGTLVAPIVRAVVGCRPASILDAVGRQLKQADPALALSADQTACVVGGFLDVVAANPSLVNVVLGGTRIGGLPADIRTRITTELTPKVQSCVGADTTANVLAAVDRL
ncbi:MAG: hypothetical protein ACKO91_04965 [Acidimicrobiales bacterium]